MVRCRAGCPFNNRILPRVGRSSKHNLASKRPPARLFSPRIGAISRPSPRWDPPNWPVFARSRGDFAASPVAMFDGQRWAGRATGGHSATLLPPPPTQPGRTTTPHNPAPPSQPSRQIYWGLGWKSPGFVPFMFCSSQYFFLKLTTENRPPQGRGHRKAWEPTDPDDGTDGLCDPVVWAVYAHGVLTSVAECPNVAPLTHL